MNSKQRELPVVRMDSMQPGVYMASIELEDSKVCTVRDPYSAKFIAYEEYLQVYIPTLHHDIKNELRASV